MIDGASFVFWKYLKEYGIFDEELLEYVGFRDDAPEEVKKSWEEYQKLMKQYEIRGFKP